MVVVKDIWEEHDIVLEDSLGLPDGSYIEGAIWGSYLADRGSFPSFSIQQIFGYFHDVILPFTSSPRRTYNMFQMEKYISNVHERVSKIKISFGLTLTKPN